MKKLLLSLGLVMSFGGISQTILYQENFESGNSFTLNTTDLGGSSTFNTWLVNNSYTGGTGTLTCLGFPFSFTITNTNSQPVGITNAPSSNYLHISAQSAIASGITCASYASSDGGTCVSDETNFSKMTNPVSTVGYTGVSFDFWWMCAGSTGGAYGEVYYSLDGGTSWILKQSNLNNVTNWTNLTLTDPAWDNVPSLQFGFRFVNNSSLSAADPAFSVDEIVLTGNTSSNTITTDLVSTTGWCEGESINITVDFTATGTYNSGNVFSAEISDATGAFTTPTVIGTFASSVAGSQSISATIPGSLTAGTAYRVRVIASDPSTIGTDNGTDLSIYSLPPVSQASLLDVCVNASPVNLVSGSPSGGTYSGIGVSGGMFDPSVAGLGTHAIDYTITSSNGCENTATEYITVLDAPVVTMSPLSDVCIDAPAFSLTGGSPSGGTYSGIGVSGGIFDPATAGIGTWTIQYDYTGTNGCSNSAMVDIQVSNCLGLDDNSKINFTLYPNPADDSFMLLSEESFERIELKDVNGRFIQAIEPNTLVDVSELSAGVYFVEIVYNGMVYSQRMVVK